MVDSTPPWVELKSTGITRGRPPQSVLFFEVVLRNHADGDRWFLLPARLPLSVMPPAGGVTGVETFSLGGSGDAMLARFFGTGGFQTLMLPAASRVRCVDFGISLWEMSPSDEVFVEVVIAREVTIGGDPIQDWVGRDFRSDPGADVSGSIRQRLVSRDVPDHTEVPVVVDEERRFRVNVPLINREQASAR